MKKTTWYFSVLLILLVNYTSAQVNLNQNLIAYLQLNGNANDVSGNGNIFTTTTGGLYPTQNWIGQGNQAMQFNGDIETSGIYGPAGLANNFATFTACAWVNPAEYNNTNSQGLFGQDNLLEVAAVGNPNRIQAYNANLGTSNYNISIPVGTWYHLLVMGNGSFFSVYVNGIQVINVTGNASLGSNTNPFNLGDNVTSQTGADLNGKIDDFRLYNRILTQDEIDVLSGSGSLTYLLGNSSSTNLCAGENFTVPLTVIGNNLQSNNTFELQLSDASGNFNNPLTLAVLNGSSSGVFNATIPSNVYSGNNYKIRTVSTLPLFIGAISSETIIISNPTQGLSTLSNQRILWYQFDANAADSSGNNLNATLFGGTSYVSDRFGNTTGALQLNGSNGYVEAPDGAYFDEGNYAVSTWIKPTSFNSWSRIYDFGNANASDNVLAALSNLSSGNLAAQNYNAATGGFPISASTGAILNQWNHVLVQNINSILYIYLNGNLIVSGAAQTPRLINRTNCYIGRSNWLTDGFTNAAIDDFMIFNRELTQDEILALANDGLIYYNQTPCTGGSLFLNAPTIAGASYQWTGPDGFNATQAQNIINNVSAINSGNYTLNITVGNCAPYNETQNISVVSPSSQPTVSFTGLPAQTNTGVQPITLSGTPGGGFFFGSGIQNVNQFNPASAGAGTHIIYYSVQGSGACITTATDTVIVLNSYNQVGGTITSCSGGFYDSGGSGTGYSANENTTQTFCTGTSDKFRFNFASFNFGTGDTLFVYDGNSVSANLIGYYLEGSGTDVLWSTSSCITFHFKSNANNQGTGWIANYECSQNPELSNEATTMTAGMHSVCGITLYDPSGSGNYGQGYWQHTFRAAPNQRLQFQYSAFAINGNNGGHWLRIYDGPTTSYPLIGQYNNFNFIPAIIQSSGEYLTFVFDATNTNAGFGGNSGFVGNLTCFGTALPTFNMSNTTIATCSAVYYDNGGPAIDYSPNHYLKQTICSDNGEHIQLRFNNNLSLFDSGDTLWVYDGTDSTDVLMGMYIQGSNIERLTSSSTCLTFRFKSNSSTEAGWQGYIQCVPTLPIQDTILISSGIRTTCNAYIADASQAYAYGYGYNIQTYQSYNGERLKFQYSSLSINGNNGGHWLRIYDGPSNAYPMIGQYNNFNFIPPSIESTGQYLTFEFDRNNTNAGVGTAQGYSGILSCTTPSLPIYNMNNGTITTCGGVFYDDGGNNGPYTTNANYVQTFCSANNQLLQITFNVNETSIGSGDTLWAYDGANTNASPLAIYISGSRIERLTSTGTCLTFKWTSNGTSNNQGWQGIISCIITPPTPVTYTMSSGTRYVCNGVLLDPGGSGNYPVGSGNIYEQTFISYSGERLRATVNSININGNNGGHWLRVYDGPSTASPLIGSYNNFNGWPPAFESTGSELTFRFESTNTNAGANPGFQLTFSCFTGSPIDVAWLNSPICRGALLSVPFNLNTSVNANNTYTAQLSDANGSFASATNIGTLNSIATSDTVFATIPIGTPAGNGYRIRVNSSQPVQLGSPNPNPINILLTPVQPGNISLTGTSSFCGGQDSAILSINNQLGMNYQWIKNDSIAVGINSNSFTATSPGNYSVAIYNNCDSIVSTSSVSISLLSSPVAPVITTNGPTDFCPGGNVQLSVPTQSGVSYQWKNGTQNVGSNSNTYTATTTGNYTVTVSNLCGDVLSVNSISVVVSGNAPIAPSISASDITICAGENSTLSVSPQAGVSYQWLFNGNNVGADSAAYIATQNGTYTITLSNACGTVLGSNSIILTVNANPSAPLVSSSAGNTICTGQTTQLEGPAGFGNYLWSNGANSQSISIGTAGDYWLMVTDGNGCSSFNSDTLSIAVIAPPALPLLISVDTICAGNSAQINVSASNNVQWYDASSGGNNLGQGTNFITSVLNQQSNFYAAADNNICESTSRLEVIVVVNQNPLVILDSISDAGCNGAATGSIYISATGAGTLQYLWNNGNTNQDLNNIAAGVYSVSISDSNTCFSVLTNINVSENSSINVSPQVTNVNCYGDTSGAITTIVTGGLPPFSYLWSTGASTSFLNNLSVGGYSLQVTDAANCVSFVGPYFVDGPDSLTLSFLVTDQTISNPGAIDLSISGGTPIYSVVWSNGAITEDLNNLTAGNYSVQVIDQNNCSASGYATVLFITGIATNENNFTVYPNPANEYLFIESGNKEIENLILFDVLGRVVYYDSINSNIIKLDLQQLAIGVYDIQLHFKDGGISRQKLIIGR